MPPGHERVRVRFAPNGEIPFAAFFTRTVLYSWLFARHYGGSFVLRLDDTDVDRQTPGALESYAEGLRWLDLDWDEGPEVGGDFGPYRQSERLHLYTEAVEMLLASGAAYPCYCSPERLAEVAAAARRPGNPSRPYDGYCRNLTLAEIRAAEREGRRPAIRLRVPDTGSVDCFDLLRGVVSVQCSDLGDFIICRPDGWATYHLTVTVDDSLMHISHVIRGVEGLSNMAPQALVHRALGLEPPYYLHHPLVRTPGFVIGDRFLPRGHLLYLDELRAAGWPPQAVVNYFAQLGYGGEQGVQSLDELIDGFDYKRISRKEFVNQDQDKLAWMSRKYLHAAASKEFVFQLVLDRLLRHGVSEGQARPLALRAAPIVRRRLSSADDCVELLKFAWMPTEKVTATAETTRWAAAAVEAVSSAEAVPAFVDGLSNGDRDVRRRINRTLLALLGAGGTPFSLAEAVGIIGERGARDRWRTHAH